MNYNSKTASDQLDIESLLNEIRNKYNISIDKNDPILVTALLNDVILQHAITMLMEKNRIHQIELSAALDQHISTSKQTASRLIEDAADFVSNASKESILRTLEQTLEQYKTSEDTIEQGTIKPLIAVEKAMGKIYKVQKKSSLITLVVIFLVLLLELLLLQKL